LTKYKKTFCICQILAFLRVYQSGLFVNHIDLDPSQIS